MSAAEQRREYMKKTICMILAATVIILSALPVSAQRPDYPVIIVSGYSSGNLYENFGTESQKTVWPFGAGDAIGQTLRDLPNFVRCLITFLLGNGAPLGVTVAQGGEIILEKMYTNPDGSSKYNVVHYPNKPEISSYGYLLRNAPDEINEPELCKYCAGKVGKNNVFLFQYDFRMGAYDSALELSAYIKEVCKYTGSKKVDIFGLSFGGFITGAYLSMFKKSAPVNNAVLDVPALGGTSFTRRFFMGETEFCTKSLIALAESLIGGETNIAPVLKNLDLSRIEPLAEAFLKEIRELPVYWGSLWDLLTPEDYRELKPKFLDKKASRELIRKSDIIHYDIMKNYRSNFLECMKRGINISVICNYVDYTAFGGEKLADMLLYAERTSGAVCSGAEKRLPDGYKPARTVCKNKSHNHLAPSMQIDASTSYLPEHTWFIKDEYHGCYAKDPYGFNLIKTLLFAEKRMNIRTNPDYPQFNYSRAPYRSVAADFSGCKPGYIGRDEGKLTVSNLSEKMNIIVVDIRMDGMKFTLPAGRVLAPGKTLTVKYEGEKPGSYEALTVYYVKPALGKDIYQRSIDIVPC